MFARITVCPIPSCLRADFFAVLTSCTLKNHHIRELDVHAVTQVTRPKKHNINYKPRRSEGSWSRCKDFDGHVITISRL